MILALSALIQFAMQQYHCNAAGVAISMDGVNWQRSAERVSGIRGADAATDSGEVLEPNKDWWTFDTCHMEVSDVQVGALAAGSEAGTVGADMFLAVAINPIKCCIAPMCSVCTAVEHTYIQVTICC